MKGEALGLRAFHYFDLLRLYGPVYSEDPEMKCLPWRTEFNADQKSLESAGVIAQHILEDLTQNDQNGSQGVDGKSVSLDWRQGKRCAESQGGDRAVWTGARDKQYPGCLPV